MEREARGQFSVVATIYTDPTTIQSVRASFPTRGHRPSPSIGEFDPVAPTPDLQIDSPTLPIPKRSPRPDSVEHGLTVAGPDTATLVSLRATVGVDRTRLQVNPDMRVGTLALLWGWEAAREEIA